MSDDYHSRLAYRLAAESDLSTLVALRDTAARWMVSNGIDQWKPGTLGEDHFRQRMVAGEVWVAQESPGGRVVGAWELWWDDERTWGRQSPMAGYIHRLMIDHRLAPRGAGRMLLAAAEDRIVAAGKRLARLDCAAHNLRLRRYYLDAVRSVSSRCATVRRIRSRSSKSRWAAARHNRS